MALSVKETEPVGFKRKSSFRRVCDRFAQQLNFSEGIYVIVYYFCLYSVSDC